MLQVARLPNYKEIQRRVDGPFRKSKGAKKQEMYRPFPFLRSFSCGRDLDSGLVIWRVSAPRTRCLLMT